MTTSKDKLEKIVHFKEEVNKQSYPVVSLTYIEMVSDYDENKMRAMKAHNRDLAIDILLDEKDESEWDNRNILPNTLEEQLSPFGGGYINTISPKIMSMNVSGSKFTDYDSLYVDVINYINNLTKSPKTFSHGTSSLDYTITNDPNKTDSENIEINTRRVITKILSASNLISSEGRIGPGTAVLVGQNVDSKVDLSIIGSSGIKLIVEPLIDPDKVIVCRGDRPDSSGIILMTFPNDSRYFLKETSNSWDKQYCWFTVV